MTAPPGSTVPSPRKHRCPSTEPGMSTDPLPTSHRSPTVAPMTRHRWPKTVRCPILVAAALLPTATEFSSRYDPEAMCTEPSMLRMETPGATPTPSPAGTSPSTTAESATWWRTRPGDAAGGRPIIGAPRTYAPSSRSILHPGVHGTCRLTASGCRRPSPPGRNGTVKVPLQSVTRAENAPPDQSDGATVMS